MIHFRRYGSSGPEVVVLHGGPATPGHMAPVARELADAFEVTEPWQRGSGAEPLTVARHVADLHALVDAHCSGRPALLGASWGAMLALAYAATHPGSSAALVLVGCGTFDAAARQHMHAILAERMDPALKRRLANLPKECPEPNERLGLTGNLILPLYSFSPATTDLELERCDARAHHETWEDMLRLQDEGVYPAAFAAVDVPVLMLHGAVDPHPGHMIRASLQAHLPQLEYVQWEHCGHYPWLETTVRDEFFSVLRPWLSKHCEAHKPGV